MIHFLNLIRYKNLLIIAITFYSIRFFYLDIYDLTLKITFNSILEKVDFFLLVLSTLMIAAAGNVINDYFDIKADRVNKPEKLIVGKYITKRYAIKLQWILNSLAIVIAIYLSLRHQSFWFFGIHFFAINALWIYSMYYKRAFIIGNFVVAVLTALVPLTSGIYFLEMQNTVTELKTMLSPLQNWVKLIGSNGGYIYGFMFFAFLINFSREIIKDILDIKGDLELKSKTFAIVVGENKARFLSAIILLLSPILLTYTFLQTGKISLFYFQFFLPLFIAQALILFVSFGVLFHFLKLETHQKLLKFAMLLGILLPFYWSIF